MAENIKGQKKKSRIKFSPIISLLMGLTFLTLILFIAFLEIGKSGKYTIKKNNINPLTEESNEEITHAYNQSDQYITAVVLEINKSDKTIRLFDIDKKEEISLNYTGGSNILDKFDQVISMSQVEIGWIVDANYQSSKNKLTFMQPSSKAWEYLGVNNMTIKDDEKTITIAKSKYTYDQPLVVDNDKLITLEDLAVQDELTVRGIDEVIWSIIVTKGHGTVRLKDYDAFLGGSITVGYEAVGQITEDMSITVREGNYNLTVENGEYSGTKNITIYRNKETVVSLGDLGPEPVQYGQIEFDITPFGADLFIDGELTPYAGPVKLSYGEHSIEVSLGGYASYRSNLNVDYAGKKIQIVLPELQSRETVRVVETGEIESEGTENIEYNDWDNEQYGRGDYPEYIDSIVDNNDMDDDPIVDKDHLIYIQNPTGASVYINGEFKGISPGSFQKIIGSHVLTFIKKGYQTKSYTIDIADDGLDTYISLPDLIPEW